MKSLFGHIVLNYTSQAEDLATEALHYILSNSNNARSGISRFLGTIDSSFTDDLFFKTQDYGDDNAIPDLVGVDSDNDPICIIESKFWAGLTDNQPVTYIKRLNPDKTSILLFLVPSKRLESIWNEIINRCKDSGIAVYSEIRNDYQISANLNENNYIAIIDWNSLLTLIETELDNAGDYLIKSDLLQLKGLCNQMDEESFLPIDSVEISPMIAKRNMQFYDILNEVKNIGVSKGIYSKEGLTSGGGIYYYTNYFKIDEFFYGLKFDNESWSKRFNTPIWLEVYGKGWRSSPEERPIVKKALSDLESYEQNRLFFDQSNVALIPLKIELGVEKNKVVESLILQIEEINHILNENYRKLTKIHRDLGIKNDETIQIVHLDSTDEESPEVSLEVLKLYENQQYIDALKVQAHILRKRRGNCSNWLACK